jgi:hypothetical protein
MSSVNDFPFNCPLAITNITFNSNSFPTLQLILINRFIKDAFNFLHPSSFTWDQTVMDTLLYSYLSKETAFCVL